MMKEEDKREILETFDLTEFTEDELLRVRKYGLFTNGEVARSLVTIIKKLRDEKKEFQDEKEVLENLVTDLQNEKEYLQDWVNDLQREKEDLQNWMTEFEAKLTGKPYELKSDLLQRFSRLKKEVADRRTTFD